MSYRRRQQQQQQQVIIEDDDESNSLAAKAMRASSSYATRRDSSLSSAYGPRPVPPPSASSSTTTTTTTTQPIYNNNLLKDHHHHHHKSTTEYTSFNSYDDDNSNSKHAGGFWGSLARKAKAFIDDNNINNDNAPPPPPPQTQTQTQTQTTTAPAEYHNPYKLNESARKTEGPLLQKGLGRISSSISYIGNAVEEGLTKVENRTAGIIQETRKHIKKKPSSSYQTHNNNNHETKQSQVESQVKPLMQTDLELQLKASRDVSMAMAAKAKLLLRELKTVKADFAFAKERCAQLEEENKILRENRERGGRPEDDDLIRLQLESLLAEKARLAHENSVFARENRFLREVVEYHQLTMQDVVYLDEGTEEVSEVYPIKVVSDSQPASTYSMPNPSLHPFRGLHPREFPSESD